MTEEHLPSKFAFILHADIAGSTTLVRQDEELAHKRIRDTFRRFGDIIKEYHGQVRELRGDALLAEFARASDAVTAALAFQQGQFEYTAQLKDHIRPSVRIGVAMGEVIVADNTVTGAGVVLAQRLEQLSEPGGIVVQGAIHETLPRRLPFAYGSLGEQVLKGFDEPVRAYSVSLPAGLSIPPAEESVPSREEPSLTLPDRPSIAVLPFTNMSGVSEQEYFSDGIAEDIITGLSRFRGLFVTARNSTFTYKGRPTDVSRIARELGVRYVLEGSTRRADDRVRVSAQLIDALTRNHLWAEQYDRKLSDLFLVQDDITHHIVGAIDAELRTAEQERAKRRPPDSLQVWELYHRAIWHFYRYTKPDVVESRTLLRRTIERDPNFAPGHAALAYLGYMEIIFGFSDAVSDTLKEALGEGKIAVSLDDQDAFGHTALGRVYTMMGEHERAIDHLELAVELNPNFARAHYGLGFALVWAGRPEDALSPIDTALQLNPRDPLLWAELGAKSTAYYALGNYQAAAEWARKAIQHQPMEGWPYVWLAAALGQLGRDHEARVTVKELLERKPEFSIGFVEKAINPADPQIKSSFIDGLSKAKLPK